MIVLEPRKNSNNITPEKWKGLDVVATARESDSQEDNYYSGEVSPGAKHKQSTEQKIRRTNGAIALANE